MCRAATNKGFFSPCSVSHDLRSNRPSLSVELDHASAHCRPTPFPRHVCRTTVRLPDFSRRVGDACDQRHHPTQPLDNLLQAAGAWQPEDAASGASLVRIGRAYAAHGYSHGEVFKQPDLAATLKRIQKDGRDGFYKGKTAKLFAKYMEETGGIITEKDLEIYEAEELPVIKGTYRGYDIYGMAPPSSGGVAVVEMLNILEGFNLKEMGHNSAMYLHVLTEAMRRAFADRAQHLGDPNFNPDIPIERLISKGYAKELRQTFDLFQASPSDSSKFNDAHLAFESEETTHFSVVDKEGNAVSLTYTLEYGYGSRSWSWMAPDSF